MFPQEIQGYRTGGIDVSRSDWTSYHGATLEFPPLQGEWRADVVIVGAGLAGSLLALHLTEGGVSTALVDPRESGWGG